MGELHKGSMMARRIIGSDSDSSKMDLFFNQTLCLPLTLISRTPYRFWNADQTPECTFVYYSTDRSIDD